MLLAVSRLLAVLPPPRNCTASLHTGYLALPSEVDGVAFGEVAFVFGAYNSPVRPITPARPPRAPFSVGTAFARHVHHGLLGVLPAEYRRVASFVIERWPMGASIGVGAALADHVYHTLLSVPLAVHGRFAAFVIKSRSYCAMHSPTAS